MIVQKKSRGDKGHVWMISVTRELGKKQCK
jgi:hypothetical protein